MQTSTWTAAVSPSTLFDSEAKATNPKALRQEILLQVAEICEKVSKLLTKQPAKYKGYVNDKVCTLCILAIRGQVYVHRPKLVLIT